MLLQDRQKTENEIYKAMQEIDQIALRGSLKISKSDAGNSHSFGHFQTNNETYHLGKSLNVTKQTLTTEKTKYKAKNNIFNTYPISPTPQLGTGYGFDVRI